MVDVQDTRGLEHVIPVYQVSVAGAAMDTAGADALANPTVPQSLALHMAFNGTTWDRWRNNVAATALATAARTATTNSADLVNYNAKGVQIAIDITVTPNNAETLTMAVQVKDQLSGKYVTITAFATILASGLGAAPTTATFIYTMYPGGAETAAVGNHEVQSLPIPRNWRIQVVHSSTTAWNYTVGYQYVL